MVNLGWFSLILIVSICSIVQLNGEVAPEPIVQPFERSPTPNLDIYDVQMSMSSKWFDTIDAYFYKTINAGKNILKEIAVTGYKVMGKVVDFLPTPEGVFRASKDILLGLPQEAVIYAIDAFCNVASHVGSIIPTHTPEKEQMHLEFVTADMKKIAAPLDNPESICTHPDFKKDWPTVIVVTGWLSNVNSPLPNDALDGLMKAYHKRDVNFMFFDTAEYVDTLYTWSAFNTKVVGELIGQSLVDLTKCVDPKNIHLIGHSLGAHMCGYAARTFHNLTKDWIPRVTGLDPANPCFREGEAINGLQRGDALFVDIIHSNCGVLGRRSPLGDVDFFPNGRHPLQPGCLSIVCSHGRSWEFYAESVEPGREKSFLAVRCDSYSSLKAGHCGGEPIPMGYAVPITAKGDYFLGTNSDKPYGMGQTLFEFYKFATKLSERILFPVRVPDQQSEKLDSSATNSSHDSRNEF